MSDESNGIAGAIRNHRLFRIATVYAVAGWIAIQVADIVLETFESPVWIMQTFLTLVLAGFPTTLTVVWLIDRARERGASRSLVPIATIILASLISFGAYQYFRADESVRDVASPVAPKGLESGAVAAVGPDERPAIAVLPFNNPSPDAEQAHFADGLAEDLITRLSSWRAFPVIARNSSFQYRRGNVDLKRVSGELGVRYVVEGSVRRAGDRIRVNAQLIDATSGDLGRARVGGGL